MTAQTPGQAFRDTLRERWVARGRCVDIRDYADLPREDREDLEAAAQAAIDSFLAGDSVSAESIRGALAARERPVPTRAELETAMAAAIQDLIDEDAAREPQPAPELAAAMAESHRYREALTRTREALVKATDDAQRRIRIARSIVTAALDGR